MARDTDFSARGEATAPRGPRAIAGERALLDERRLTIPLRARREPPTFGALPRSPLAPPLNHRGHDARLALWRLRPGRSAAMPIAQARQAPLSLPRRLKSRAPRPQCRTWPRCCGRKNSKIRAVFERGLKKSWARGRPPLVPRVTGGREARLRGRRKPGIGRALEMACPRASEGHSRSCSRWRQSLCSPARRCSSSLGGPHCPPPRKPKRLTDRWRKRRRKRNPLG